MILVRVKTVERVRIKDQKLNFGYKKKKRIFDFKYDFFLVTVILSKKKSIITQV
jgi:hypothetical protein